MSLLPGGLRDSLLSGTSTVSTRKESEEGKREESSQGQEERLKPVVGGVASHKFWRARDPMQTRVSSCSKG